MIIKLNTDTGLIEVEGEALVEDFYVCRAMIDDFFNRLAKNKISPIALTTDAILDLKNAIDNERNTS